jgi:hypothetical protein
VPKALHAGTFEGVALGVDDAGASDAEMDNKLAVGVMT